MIHESAGWMSEEGDDSRLQTDLLSQAENGPVSKKH
jgi:hypothetical protein